MQDAMVARTLLRTSWRRANIATLRDTDVRMPDRPESIGNLFVAGFLPGAGSPRCRSLTLGGMISPSLKQGSRHSSGDPVRVDRIFAAQTINPLISCEIEKNFEPVYPHPSAPPA